jgi:hypothetical protein
MMSVRWLADASKRVTIPPRPEVSVPADEVANRSTVWATPVAPPGSSGGASLATTARGMELRRSPSAGVNVTCIAPRSIRPTPSTTSGSPRFTR